MIEKILMAMMASAAEDCERITEDIRHAFRNQNSEEFWFLKNVYETETSPRLLRLIQEAKQIAQIQEDGFSLN